jgi:peptidoglycan/xylan/chitin deacetylase (PgdA/CDA1 family)
MKSLTVPFLLLGIVLGAVGTSLALGNRPLHLVEREFSKMEEVTESDLGENVVYDPQVVKPSSTTSTYVISEERGMASATSSPYSVKIPVIIYHSVRPYMQGESKYQDLYDVTPELLAEELNYIEAQGYHTVDMRDVDAYWRGATTSLPEKPVMLTFDDGWRNQFEYAYPLLKQHHMKGVFYIFTNPIDHQKTHWMSWDEVRELDRAGMEVAGHTRTHPLLTKITTDAKLDHEILESKKIIETEIGHPIISFAYPFGAKNAQVVAAVKRAGYVIARTTYSGVWNDPDHHLDFHGTLSSDKLTQFVSLLNRP